MLGATKKISSLGASSYFVGSRGKKILVIGALLSAFLVIKEHFIASLRFLTTFTFGHQSKSKPQNSGDS